MDLSRDGQIDKAAIAASQMDWKELQQKHSKRWAELVKTTFGNLDHDHDGVLKAADIIEVRPQRSFILP